MSFTNTTALFLLLLLPVFIWIGFPRLAYRRRRDTAALILRCLIIILIVFSLAGLQARQEADKLAVVFVIDHSASMDNTARSAAEDYVTKSIEYMNEQNEGDQAAVIIFGSDAVVEHPMDELVDVSQFGAKPVITNTDMAEAIRLGLALFPADTAKRMVILSDGLETVGDARQAARLAEATGVQIDYISFAREPSSEILVRSLQTPAVVSEGENFDLQVTIESTHPGPVSALLSVRASGSALDGYPQEIIVEPGVQTLPPITFSSENSGFINFEVQIDPLGTDGFEDNNFLAAFTRVVGQEKILVISPEVASADDVDEGRFIVDALEGEGFIVDRITPQEVPFGLPQLSTYSSIVMTNVSATELTPEQMELLQVYVRDLGGGLVAVGGDNSYAVGGYFQTPLEDTLPVEMRIRDEERVPPLSMLFVIDTSGSMQIAGPSGISNLDLAKEAVLRSFDFLNNDDKVGVLSFDTLAYWVIDLQTVGDQSNRRQLGRLVASLRPGGGTDIFGGLREASQVLPGDDSVLKHIILLTDGGASEEGIPELVGRMYETNQITTSVVAVGDDYARWLHEVERRGNGNFHLANDVRSIPTIFASETVLATRSYIFEDPFVPVQTARSPIVEGITAVPQLYGYVASTPKDTATVILAGPEEDPILASWQYGLGRSVAFTSDATARWGSDWISWENYTNFWNQVVSWTITEGKDSNIEARVEQRGEDAVLVVDARDNRGSYLNALDLSAGVVYPESRDSETLVQLKQVAPGRYEGIFEPTEEGAYFVRISGATLPDADVEASVAETTGWVLSYSSEYSLTEPDVRFLEEISAITEGNELPRLTVDTGNESEVVRQPFIHNLDQEEAALPLFPYLLAIAAVLLIFDIAVRRLVINKSDIDRLREALFMRREPVYEETQTAGRMSGLMEAKRRATVVDDAPEAVDSGQGRSKSPLPPRRQTSAASTRQEEPVQEEPRQRGRRSGGRRTSTPEAAPENSLASRLLKKKQGEDDV